MKKKTTKKTKNLPKKLPDFVSRRNDYSSGKLVYLYYAGYSDGKKLIRITKQEYESLRKKILVEIDKKLLERKQGGKRGRGVVPGAGHCWPMQCEALACHPDQVKSLNERNKRHGINVEYDRKGFAIIPDQAAYRRLMKAEGVHQNNTYN